MDTQVMKCMGTDMVVELCQRAMATATLIIPIRLQCFMGITMVVELPMDIAEETGDPWVRFLYCSSCWSSSPKRCLSSSYNSNSIRELIHTTPMKGAEIVSAPFSCLDIFLLKVDMEKHPEPNSGCFVYVFNLLKNK